MTLWDPKKWRNPARDPGLGPDFEVRNLFYSPAVRAYIECQQLKHKYSRWEHVLSTPSAFQLIINKRFIVESDGHHGFQEASDGTTPST